MEAIIAGALQVLGGIINSEAQANQIEAQKFFLEGKFERSQAIEIGLLAALLILVLALLFIPKK